MKIIGDLNELIEKKNEIEADIDEISEDIEKNKLDLEKITLKFPKMSVYEEEQRKFNYIKSILEKDIEKIEKSLLKIDEELEIELISIDSIENKNIFKKINKELENILKNRKNIFLNLQTYKNSINEINSIYENQLKIIYNEQYSKFKEYCKEKKIQENIKIKDYIINRENELNEFKLEIEDINQKIADLNIKKEELEKDIDELYNKQTLLFEEWEKKADKFTNIMKGTTKIEIIPESDIDEFKSILKEIGLNNNQIKKIINEFSPIDFISLFKSNENNFKKKLLELKFKEITTKKIYYNITESIQYKFKLCINKPTVKFSLKKNEKFFPINELSTGERCVTLLNFIFCESIEPIIIDQPEDNIDYNYIQSTIKILKNQKLNRQFVIVSHNQNLPVLADADLLFSMKNIKDEKIIVEFRGSLENENIHQSILNLEGGKEAFELRNKKYQLIEI